MKKLVLAAAMCLWLLPAGSAVAKDKTITVGFTISETGRLNADSQPQFRGFEMWRDQVNANGGITVGNDHYKIKLVSYDDQSRPGRVQQLYSRLILQDGAAFLFSPYSSALTATAAIVSEQYGKIMITTGAAEGKTYMLGNKYLFQLYTPAARYLVSALEVIKDEDPDARIALVYSNDGFSRSAAEGARKAAGEMGLHLVLNQAYAPDTTDFGPVLNKIVASGADVLIGGGHYADGSTLVRQLHDKKVNLRLITLLVAPDIPKFSSLGAAAVGVSVPSQWEPNVSYKPDFGPAPQAFTLAYEKRFGVKPGYHAAGGYAAGLILEHAIKQAGSLKTGDVAKVLNAMDAMTFYGHVKFSTDPVSHGLQIGHDMVLAQWQEGKNGQLASQVVWPAAAANAPILYPLQR